MQAFLLLLRDGSIDQSDSADECHVNNAELQKTKYNPVISFLADHPRNRSLRT
jgi:hypothetical protein